MTQIPLRLFCSMVCALLVMAATDYGVQARAGDRDIGQAKQDRQTASAWNDRLYKKYDYKSFATFEPARQPVVRERMDRPLLTAAIFYATNEQRVKHYRTTLKYYDALAEAAEKHSKAMTQYGFFSHLNPVDKSLRTVQDRFAAQHIPQGAWAENIAKTYVKEKNGETYLAFARRIVKQWMDSSGHRKNILNPDFNYLGCGVSDEVKDGFLYIFATQAFSKTAAPEARP